MIKKLLSVVVTIAIVEGILSLINPVTANEMIVKIGVAVETDTVTRIQDAVQSAVDAHETVIVTGTFIGADTMLTINIPEGKKVEWAADYSGASDLVYIKGEGVFEVNGGTVKTTTGMAIQGEGVDLQVMVSNGGWVASDVPGGGQGAITMFGGFLTVIGADSRVESASGAAVYTWGDVNVEDGGEINGASGIYAMGGVTTFSNSNVTINGGKVRATNGIAVFTPLDGLYSQVTVNDGEVTSANSRGTIVMGGLSVTTSGIVHHCFVTVSGHSKVENTSSGDAIMINGNITVDDGEISANSGNAIAARSVDSPVTVTVNGGKISSASGSAIYSASTVRLRVNISDGLVKSGNTLTTRGTIHILVIEEDAESIVTVSGGRVENTSSGNAINTGKDVVVSGGEISAVSGIAIRASGVNSQVAAIGGSVTANTIGNRFGLTGDNGIAVEWTGKGTLYTPDTALDISTAGAGATAYWNIENGKHGISFSRNTNIGFVEIPGVTVGVVCDICGELPCECTFRIDVAGDVIEIYNLTDTAVSARGLYLSEDQDDFFKWKMPPVIIKAGEIIQITTDDDDSHDGLKRLQANFDLDNWETLCLTDAGGNVLAMKQTCS